MTSTAKEGIPTASNANNDARNKKQKRTIVDVDSSSSTAVPVVPALSLRNILLYFPDLLIQMLPYIAGRTIFNSIASSNKDVYKKSKSILPPWPMNYKLTLNPSFAPLWSPCGTRIACLTNNNGNIVVHDQRYGPFHNNENYWSINNLKFSPDGNFLVSTSDDRIVTLWDNNNGNYNLQRWNIEDEVTDEPDEFCLIDVSPCSKYIIVSPSYDISFTNHVFLKSVENRGKTINSLTPHPIMGSIIEIKFSIDGRAVFVCGKNIDNEKVIMLWRPYLDDADEDSWITLWAPTIPTYVEYTHVLSHDSTMIAIHDKMNHNGWLLSMGNDYNYVTDDLHFPAGVHELHELLHFTPDKKFIVYRTNNGLKNWNIAEHKWMDTTYYLYNGKEMNNRFLSCSPNYRQFIVQDNDCTHSPKKRVVSVYAIK